MKPAQQLLVKGATGHSQYSSDCSRAHSCVQLSACASRLCGLGTLSLYDEAVAWTRTLQSSGVGT